MDADAIGDHDIVIIGGGLCGLATALALHRKGMKCVVFERSESLRATGAAIGIMPNGWRALDQLGVGSTLRHTAHPILGAQDIWLSNNKKQAMPFMSMEARCLRRSDLINTLYKALPPDIVKFGHHIVSVKVDPRTTYPVLQLQDGRSIMAKVLIGCDGANSVVADFLGLKPTKLFGLCSIRGLTNYPDGHPFTHEFVRMRVDNILVGRIPIDRTTVYWFVAQTDVKISQDPDLIKQWTLESIKRFPQETIEMIKLSDSDSLSLTRLRYRAPWDILLGRFRKGTITVAGDAMHVMGPFLGQGGSAGLEDAVVLGRHLSRKMTSSSTDPTEIGEALDQFIRERRMRVFRLSTQTYLTGTLLTETSSLLVKFSCIILMVIFFSNASGHAKYDCGTL